MGDGRQLQNSGRRGTQKVEELLSFPCACPVANRALHAALLEDSAGQATVSTDKCYVVRAKTLDGAEVVSTVADIDNALVFAVGMGLPKCIKLITLAHAH